jgi:hypothetical protein
MAGYSTKPLIAKLGMKDTMKIFLVNAPKDYKKILGCDITHQLVDEISEADFAQLFVTSKDEFKKSYMKIISSAKSTLIIWISWYKKSSGIATDITEDVIREIILPTGWVDVKVCAVSDIWSGLKIAKRKNQ